MKEYVTGHYFSNCMKKIMRYLKNPELLDKDIEKQEEKYKENNNIKIYIIIINTLILIFKINI